MTYCLGIILPTGLILASDSRSSAGIDQITIVKKLTLFDVPGERVIAVLGAGNLATTQAVVSALRQNAEADGKPDGAPTASILTACTMFDAAKIVGDELRRVVEYNKKLCAGLWRSRCKLPRRRPNQGRTASSIPGLFRRQLRRSKPSHPLLSARRDQIWQADPRPRAPCRDRTRRGGETRPSLLRCNGALQSFGRTADRYADLSGRQLFAREPCHVRRPEPLLERALGGATAAG